MMKEHPILFNIEMVKAILDGRKTMTRRVIKPQPVTSDGMIAKVVPIWLYPSEFVQYCPYGQVGDRLWVRETWYAGKGYNGMKPRDLPIQTLRDHNGQYITIRKGYITDGTKPNWAGQTRTSKFMPRWASRITLEITEVTVERVQEIENHPEDYRAEGYNPLMLSKSTIDGKPFEASLDFAWFENLWNSLNAKRDYGWDVNPWVWVISFKKK